MKTAHCLDSIPGNSQPKIKSTKNAVHSLNSKFQTTNSDVQYFTMVYGVLDFKSGQLRITQAGHPSPLLIQGNKVTLLGSGGFPVGLVQDADYEEEIHKICPGDILLLYSDGITEFLKAQEKQSIEKRILTLSNKNKSISLNEIMTGWEKDIMNGSHGSDFEDDITLLALQPFLR